MNARDERLERATYLGSSDIAAVLGVSKWSSAVAVYYRKVDPLWSEDAEEDERRAKVLKRGKRFEPIVREMAEEEFCIKAVKVGERYRDPEHDWMRAEIDFEIVEDGVPVNCEVKTVHPFAAGEWGEMDTDEIPVYYAAQVMYGLMVTGRAKSYVFALFGSDNLVRYVIERDEEIIAAMREKAIKFWFDHVQARVHPEPQTYEDAVLLMDKIKRGVRCLANDAVLEALEELKTIRGHANDIKAREDTIKALVGAYAVEQAKTHGFEYDLNVVFVDDRGAEVATWKRQRGAYLDQKRLGKEKPEIKTEFTREHHYRVLAIK